MKTKIDILSNKLAHAFFVLDKNTVVIAPEKQEKTYVKSIFSLNTKNVNFPVTRHFINETISQATHNRTDLTYMSCFKFASYLLEVELPTLKNIFDFVDENLNKQQKNKFKESLFFAEKNFKSFFPNQKYKNKYEDSISILNKLLHLDSKYCFH